LYFNQSVGILAILWPTSLKERLLIAEINIKLVFRRI
jgi:hypothetical protein